MAYLVVGMGFLSYLDSYFFAGFQITGLKDIGEGTTVEEGEHCVHGIHSRMGLYILSKLSNHFKSFQSRILRQLTPSFVVSLHQ